MAWHDDSWKDGYDAWKLASPYDDEIEECFHEEREINWEGRAECPRCGETWWASDAEIEHERFLNEELDAHWRREERKARIEEWINRLAFWRRWRKPAPVDDDLPF